MKKTFLFATVIAMASLCVSCGGKKQTVDSDNAKTAQSTATVEKTLMVNTETSVLEWKGFHIVGEGHHGVINIKSGEVQFDAEGNIVGGKVVVDMNSINDLDLEKSPEQKTQLEGHLKSADFFDVETYPEAIFEIISGTAGENNTFVVNGNLTIKDKTRNININAEKMIDNEVEFANVPAFNIDRTEWDVKYGSAKLTDKAKDASIKDEIEFSAKLFAK